MPLDLLLIADAVDKRCDLEILDGTLLGLDGIRRRLGAGAVCVGFTYSALSAGSLKLLAAEASANGSFVVVGGQPARASAHSLIREPFVDAVCVNDGQPVMAALSRDAATGRIDAMRLPNVVTRWNGATVSTLQVHEDVWSERLAQRSSGNLNPEEYLARYPGSNTLRNMAGMRASNVFSKRGCPFVCSFCARQDKTVRLRNPDIVADEMEMLSRTYGVDYILDTSDTWVNVDWAEAFSLARRSRGLEELRMMVFADSRHIGEKTCMWFSKCGVDSVLLGIESGSERILHRNRKGTTREAIIRAVDLLVAAGIRVSCSFVLGLLDEDEDSLCETVDLVESLCRKDGVLCYANVIIPFMGTHVWSQAFPVERSWPSSVSRAIDYNLQEVRELYVEQCTHVTGGLRTLEAACDKILEISGLAVNEERVRVLRCAAR
jgi:radical SAM superfamily enzyme YgiQ (UPF0313 family)